VRIFKPGGGIEALEGVTPEVIAEVCGCHLSTARRWKRGEMPPLSALKIIRLYTAGELGEIDLKWRGWRLRDGVLIAPHGQSFSPGDILATTYWQQLAKSYQADQRLPRQADFVSEKWMPAKEQEREAG
jgi:hypothetical protein